MESELLGVESRIKDSLGFPYMERVKIHIHILQTDLHTFLLRIVERISFKINAFSLW